MKARQIIFAARILSSIFNPFYLPVVGLTVLLAFSYLNLLPWMYKLFLLFTFWLFTIFIPTMMIRFYRNYNGWSPIHFEKKERRAIPYLISIVSYLSCCYFMAAAHVPRFMGSIIIAALVIQMMCAAINIFINISTHMAAIGGVAGALTAFAFIFSFNPVWWLCLVIIVAGLLGTSRMILRQHSLSEVILGFVLSLICSFLSVIIY